MSVTLPKEAPQSGPNGPVGTRNPAAAEATARAHQEGARHGGGGSTSTLHVTRILEELGK